VNRLVLPLKVTGSVPVETPPTPPERLLLLGLNRLELEQFAEHAGLPKYRGRQLYEWLYKRREPEFALMTDLPASLRMTLDEMAVADPVQVVRRKESFDGTVKLLLEMGDGQRVEAVMIPEGERITACLSSQVGCAVGCGFCATARLGFKRNLSAGEIVGQLSALERAFGRRATNVVMMGMGEPLLNRNQVFKAAGLITDPEGVGISRGRFTISTAGWLPGIRAMTSSLVSRSRTDECVLPRVNLAISLNATTDDARVRLMPLAGRYPLKEIASAAADYGRASGTQVAFSYLLLAGENESDDDAGRLAALAKHHGFKINLMDYNSVGEGFSRTTASRAEDFFVQLKRNGVDVTLRTSRGADIAAACGQLAGEGPGGSSSDG